jgi:putative redox protein
MSMKISWTGKMQFQSEQAGDIVKMDAKAPIGGSRGFTPKELVVLGLAGCTAMDVIALLKKYKQDVTSLDVEMDYSLTKTYPSVFSEIKLTFDLKGNVENSKFIEAVNLSQTKYCGVSAMIAEICPVNYKIILNGEEIGAGKADFDLKEILL